jgi:hypothetical protein
MLNFYHIHNPQVNLKTWVLQMHRNSLRIAPVCPIHQINLTPKHQNDSSDTWSNTNTGHHWKWSQPVAKSLPLETSQDRYLDTEVSVSKSSVNDMLILLKTSRLWLEKHDSKTKKIDRTVSKQMINAYNRVGNINNNKSSTAARREYQWAIARGIAKEQARAVLPEGLTESRLYMNGTLRSWVHFIELRSANGTQLEHQEVARACAEVITQVFPLVKEFITND